MFYIIQNFVLLLLAYLIHLIMSYFSAAFWWRIPKQNENKQTKRKWTVVQYSNSNTMKEYNQNSIKKMY